MSTDTKQANYFVRVLIVGLCLLVGAMIAYNYIWVDPRGELNPGILTLLAILLVLVLSESFDNFSIAKLFSATREVKKKETLVNKLENEKSELLKQLISISTSQTQNQSHTNVYGDYHTTPSVKRASDEEVSEKESAERDGTEPRQSTERRVSIRDLEVKAVEKYMATKGIHKANFIPEAKLVTQFHGIDPVSNHQPIFDGYYKEDDSEVFVEFKVNRGAIFLFRERLYFMLSKIERYRKIKNVTAHLELVWLNVNIPEFTERPGNVNRLLSDFEPAIASGLLRISELSFEEAEITDCFRER